MSKENILIGTINYGTRGRDGVGITDVVVNEDNTLTFHFSDGTEQTTSPILIDGSATNYESLGNLPRINSIEIKGNKTLEDYGLDLSNYYNKLEIDNKIDNINIPETDLSNYYNKQETDNQIDTKISQIDLTDYAKKNEIPKSVSQLTNDSNYATESYVATKISEAQLGEGNVDLTNYYTKSETDTQIDTKISQIPVVDLSNYATKDEIPSTVGLATENYVNSKFDSIEIPDVSGFQLKNELATVATTGSYNDLTDLPNSQIVVGNEPGNSDIWIDTTGGETLGFATVAFSGSYNDLIDKPDIYTKLEIEQLIANQIGGIENGSY